MNGVWRVNGVLATSRALGDYPLKVLQRTSIYSIKYDFFQDKKVVVSDPDILSFSLQEHKMEFAGKEIFHV